MVDFTRHTFRGGVRSFKKTYDDGSPDETFYYKARTPAEIAFHLGSESALAADGPGGVARQKLRAKFLAESLCDETGAPVITLEDAQKLFGTTKQELCNLVIVGSNEVGDAGKD